jgi:hypothetical protein
VLSDPEYLLSDFLGNLNDYDNPSDWAIADLIIHLKTKVRSRFIPE